MRILNILPYSPCPPHFGGALRIFHLLEQMVRRHEVTLVMYGSREDERLVQTDFNGRIRGIHVVERPQKLRGVKKRLAQVGSIFRSHSATTDAYLSDAMQSEIDRVTDRSEFDIVQTENHPMGLFRVNADGAARVLDAQNVEYDNVRRMANASSSLIRRWFYTAESRKLRAEERAVFRRQDAILVTSARDQSLLETDNPGTPTFVIPNGVDTSFFRPAADPPEECSLVFTGALNYFPNADGILFFLREILPLIRSEIPDVRLYVVGSGPPKQLLDCAGENVIVTGFVDDVRPFVHRAAVYIVPLRM